MKEKGLEGYLQDNPGLMAKITSKEENRSLEDKDHSLEEAYEEYCSVIKKG